MYKRQPNINGTVIIDFDETNTFTKPITINNIISSNDISNVNIVNNSIILNTNIINTNNAIDISITRNNYEDVILSNNNFQLAKNLTEIGNKLSFFDSFNRILGQLDASSDEQELEQSLLSLSSDIHSSTINESINVSNKIVENIENNISNYNLKPKQNYNCLLYTSDAADES